MAVTEMYSGGCTRSLFFLRKPLKRQCCWGHRPRNERSILIRNEAGLGYE